MKKERIEKITRIIIALSIVGIFIADLFFAYYMDRHNASGLITFGYSTNLMLLFMFSCPVVLALVSSITFIKEMILKKIGEGERRKRKLACICFATMIAGFLLYYGASTITSTIAITMGGISVVSLIVSITALFVYFIKR